MPFVEVSQCYYPNTSLKASKAFGNDFSTTSATERLDSYANSFKRSRGEESKGSFRQSSQNELVFSTDLPIKPNEEGVYEWSKYFQLHIDPLLMEKSMSRESGYESLHKSESKNSHNITFDLYQTKKNKCKGQKLGTSRSFYLQHLKNQEVHKLTLDFRDDFESKSYGKIWIRMQYIRDELLYFKEMLLNIQNRIDLIKKWTELFSLQKASFREEYKLSLLNAEEEVDNNEWASHNAWFYSELGDSVLENESNHDEFHKLPENSDEGSWWSYDYYGQEITFVEKNSQKKSL